MKFRSTKVWSFLDYEYKNFSACVDNSNGFSSRDEKELIMLIRIDNVYKALRNRHWYPLHFKWVYLMYSGICCHILCPGDTWNHLQPLALLKTLLLGSSWSPAAKKPEVQTVCRGSLLRIVKPAWPGAVTSSLCLLPLLPDQFPRLPAMPRVQQKTQNSWCCWIPKAWMLWREGNELWLLVKPRCRKPVCLQHCHTLLTSCLAFQDISLYI